jgi:hypothetical protein
MISMEPMPTLDWISVSPSELSVGDLTAWATRENCGAVVTFCGTVRSASRAHDEVEALAYETSTELAERHPRDHRSRPRSLAGSWCRGYSPSNRESRTLRNGCPRRSILSSAPGGLRGRAVLHRRAERVSTDVETRSVEGRIRLERRHLNRSQAPEAMTAVGAAWSDSDHRKTS